MAFKGLLKNIFRKEIISSSQKTKSNLNVFVIGINHYDISKAEGQVLQAVIPQNTTHLNFPNVTKEDYEYLGLIGKLAEEGNCKYLSKDELGEKVVTDLKGLNSFMIMRPQYTITEDGRFFCCDNVPAAIPPDYLKEAVKRLKDYKET